MIRREGRALMGGMRLGIAFVVAGLLFLTVPWWFIGRDGELWGWPTWVIYTLSMNVVFALTTAVLLQRCWRRFEDPDDQGPA